MIFDSNSHTGEALKQRATFSFVEDKAQFLLTCFTGSHALSKSSWKGLVSQEPNYGTFIWACYTGDDLIPSQCDKSVGHLFAPAASSTYIEADGMLTLPCVWNSSFSLHCHALHVASSKGYRR